MVEGSILKHLWEPLSLIFNPLWIDVVLPWGVHERHFTTQLRQTGNFVDSPHVVQALKAGLPRDKDRVLTNTPGLHDQDRLSFTLSSNRLTSNFNAPISSTPTRAVSKPPNVAMPVDGTFSETPFEGPSHQNPGWRTAAFYQQSICFHERRCVGCFKLEVGVEKIRRHHCRYVDCPSCHQYVDAQTRCCYIQKALSPQEIQHQEKQRKRKRQRPRGPPAKRGAAAGLQTLRANEDGDEQGDDDEEEEELRSE